MQVIHSTDFARTRVVAGLRKKGFPGKLGFMHRVRLADNYGLDGFVGNTGILRAQAKETLAWSGLFGKGRWW